MSERREVRLKVAPAHQRDVGRGIVRIDRKAMREIGVQSGDIVEIIGTKNTAAVAWPAYPEDEGLGIIRMDGTIRKNSGVGLGDEVVIRKADVKEARRVIVAPTEPIRFGRDFVEWFHSRLVGRPVVRGDYIKVGILGQEVKYFLFQVLALGQGPSNLGVLVAGQFPGLIVSDRFVVEDIHAHGVSSFAVLISFDACSEDPEFQDMNGRLVACHHPLVDENGHVG
jgi:aspartate 1-decarboxylase